MRGGAAHDAELVRVLDQAHVVDQRAHVLHALGRGDAGAHACAHRVQPAHDARVPLGIEAHRVVQRRPVFEQLGAISRSSAPIGWASSKPKRSRARLGAVAEAVPDLALDILLAAEKDRLALPAITSAASGSVKPVR